MTFLVNHEERRNLILQHAFALFAEEGFSGVTYQKIADRCGISRTLIYKYFKDKEEIFIYAVRWLTDDLSEVVDKIMKRRDLAAIDKLRRVLRLTVRLMSRQRVFLAVILDYLLIQKQAGSDVRMKVRRYTIGMRVVLKRLILETIKERSFVVHDAEKASALLFGLLESCVLNETVIGLSDWHESLALAENFINEHSSQSNG